MAVQIETTVFVRLLLEHKQQGYVEGFAKAFSGGLKAVAATMAEGSRFSLLPDGHLEGCARDRLSLYVQDDKASCTNQVIPRCTDAK